MGKLALLAAVAASALVCAPAYADDDLTPADSYRRQSFAITTGFGVAFPMLQTSSNTIGATTTLSSPLSGFVGLGGSFRVVYRGAYLGAEFGANYIDSTGTKTLLSPGASAGAVFRLLDRLTFTAAMRWVFLVSTAPNSNLDLQVTGEAALEIFFGKHAFMEPVIAIGDYHLTGAGSSGVSNFLFATGYRLGLVF